MLSYDLLHGWTETNLVWVATWLSAAACAYAGCLEVAAAGICCRVVVVVVVANGISS